MDFDPEEDTRMTKPPSDEEYLKAVTIGEPKKLTGKIEVRDYESFGIYEGAPILDVTPASGPDGNTYAFDPSCLQTCADLQHEPAYECGVCAPASILIASGASRDFTWQGTALSAPRQMPAQCWDVPQQADSCVTLLAAAPQTYRFLVNGFANCGDGACACDSEGLCSGYATGQPGYATPSELLYPTKGKVEILFDACAFGCAEPQP